MLAVTEYPPATIHQMAIITSSHAARAPALVATAGARASYRFLEFFTALIRNPNTRRAYARAAIEFFDWLAARGVTRLTAIESVHVAAYIEQLQKARSAPTAKLRLAALRHLFDWMVIGQIMPTNPAAAVRGPRHIVRRGKPVEEFDGRARIGASRVRIPDLGGEEFKEAIGSARASGGDKRGGAIGEGGELVHLFVITPQIGVPFGVAEDFFDLS